MPLDFQSGLAMSAALPRVGGAQDDGGGGVAQVTSEGHLGVVDWLLFAIILGLTLSVGIYQSCSSNNQVKSDISLGGRGLGGDLATAFVSYTSLILVFGEWPDRFIHKTTCRWHFQLNNYSFFS